MGHHLAARAQRPPGDREGAGGDPGERLFDTILGRLSDPRGRRKLRDLVARAAQVRLEGGVGERERGTPAEFFDHPKEERAKDFLSKILKH